MPYIASMGIYVLKASAIKKLLTDHFPEVCPSFILLPTHHPSNHLITTSIQSEELAPPKLSSRLVC